MRALVNCQLTNISLIALLMTPQITFANAEQKANETDDDIEVIKVIGTKAKKSLLELTGSAALITSEDIDKLVASQLNDLFKTEPGVSVTGSSGGPQNISIRGMTGNRILILQDGARVSDGYGAADINDVAGRFNFDLEDVKTIEVAKGPASTFFGSGALGGVVKIDTKQAADYLLKDDQYLAAKALYNGSNEEAQLSLTAATKIYQLPVMMKYSNWQGSEQQNYNSSRQPLDVEGQSAKLNTQWQTNQGTLTYNADWLKQEVTNNIRPTSIPQPDGLWLVDRQGQEEILENTAHMLTWDGDANVSLADSYTIKAYWRNTEHKNLTQQRLQRTVQQVQVRYRQLFNDDLFEQTTLGLNVDLAKGYNQHELLYGLSYEQLKHQRPRIDTIIENGQQAQVTTQPFDDATTEIIGLYLGDDIDFGNGFNLLVNARYDSNSLSANKVGLADNKSSEFTASANLRYEISAETTVYTAYSQGYRAAPYDKVYGNIPHLFAFPPFEIVANTELEAETSDSLEFGFSWNNQQWQFSGSAFYTQFDGFIDWQNKGLRPSDGVLERQFVNIDQARTYGAELELGYQYNQALDVNINLGWMTGDNKETNEKLRSITPLEYSMDINYQINDLSVSALIYGQLEMDDVPVCQQAFTNRVMDCATSDSWWTTDLHLGYQAWDTLTLNLALNNVFDREYTRYQEVAGSLPLTQDLTQPSRNLSFSARYQF